MTGLNGWRGRESVADSGSLLWDRLLGWGLGCGEWGRRVLGGVLGRVLGGVLGGVRSRLAVGRRRRGVLRLLGGGRSLLGVHSSGRRGSRVSSLAVHIICTGGIAYWRYNWRRGNSSLRTGKEERDTKNVIMRFSTCNCKNVFYLVFSTDQPK